MNFNWTCKKKENHLNETCKRRKIIAAAALIRAPLSEVRNHTIVTVEVTCRVHLDHHVGQFDVQVFQVVQMKMLETCQNCPENFEPVRHRNRFWWCCFRFLLEKAPQVQIENFHNWKRINLISSQQIILLIYIFILSDLYELGPQMVLWLAWKSLKMSLSVTQCSTFRKRSLCANFGKFSFYFCCSLIFIVRKAHDRDQQHKCD